MNYGPQDTPGKAASSLNSGATDARHPDSYNWPSAEEVQKSLGLVLEHFLQHTKIVHEKLHVAKEATAQGIEDIEKVCQAYDFDEEMPVLKSVKSYEIMWDDILDKFQTHGISAKELEKIEQILTTIPTTIRVHYETLISQHKWLEDAIDALNSPEYYAAFALADEIQARPNPMSRLTVDEEFGVELVHKEGQELEATMSPQSYKIVFTEKK